MGVNHDARAFVDPDASWYAQYTSCVNHDVALLFVTTNSQSFGLNEASAFVVIGAPLSTSARMRIAPMAPNAHDADAFT
jgi:hypothetical protein